MVLTCFTVKILVLLERNFGIGLYLDSWHQSEISNEDDAQLSGHVLHDRPALITQAWGEEVAKHLGTHRYIRR